MFLCYDRCLADGDVNCGNVVPGNVDASLILGRLDEPA